MEHSGHEADLAKIAPLPLQHGKLISPNAPPTPRFALGRAAFATSCQEVPVLIAKLAVDITKVVDVDQHQSKEVSRVT